ncbi:hypothetical protein FQN60_002181 [Etheostoma spectabile]|uniref:Uncharacterized protein n=1 Tax=Etheostoma spectabile TaxID=54343 RepID=A0A5J5D954_9PERO|nr:hypothetical protein FQN60_002181 [Etheostoma spectabile]
MKVKPGRVVCVDTAERRGFHLSIFYLFFTAKTAQTLKKTPQNSSCLLPPASSLPPPALPAAMPDSRLCLEALSALSGCNVEPTPGASQLTPQDFVNIVTLKEFYKQEGFKQLEYPSLGTLSLQDEDDQDLYSAPPALGEGPSTAGPPASLRTTVKINPQDFFHPQYDYDFTHVKVLIPPLH